MTVQVKEKEEKVNVQLIRGGRYNLSGRMFTRGKTESVSPRLATYLLQRRNPRGQRFFARVEVHRVKDHAPPVPDEEIIDLDDLELESEVIEETRAVGDDGSERVIEQSRPEAPAHMRGEDISPEDIRDELGVQNIAEPLSDSDRMSLLGDPHIEDEGDTPVPV
jgi:hypothetical protein